MVIVCRILFFALFLTCVASVAQEVTTPASGPIPTPILKAKKAFVSNAGTDLNAQAKGNAASIDLGSKAYDSFYAGLQAWGHYQLVNDPADADIVFEISVRSQGGENNLSGNGLRFDLLILDARTHFTLWRFVEGFDYTELRPSAREPNFRRHMDHLLKLVKGLAEGSR